MTRKTYAGYHTQETMRLNNLMLTAEAISSLAAADVRPPLGEKLFAWELLLLIQTWKRDRRIKEQAKRKTR